MPQSDSIAVSASKISWTSRILATCCLLYFAPILLTIAIFIRVTSPGPVLLMREIYRADGRVIEVWEFRTMRFETPEWDIAGVPNEPGTKLGTFLNATRLAHLPRLLNISRGELSWRAAQICE